MFNQSILTAALGLSLTCSAVAQSKSPSMCPQAGDVVAYADTLLTEPVAPSAFWRDWESVDAIYLKLTYAPDTASQIKDDIKMLAARQRPPERIEEFLLAWSPKLERRKKVAEIIASDGPRIAFVRIGLSTLRALLLEDADWLIAEFAKAEGTIGNEATAILNAVKSIGDASDDTLQQLGEKAEKLQQFELAYQFYARKRDLDELVRFLDRAPDAFYGNRSKRTVEAKNRLLRYAVNNSLQRTDPLNLSEQPIVIRSLVKRSKFLQDAMPLDRLLARAPSASILTTLLNQTGNWNFSPIAEYLNAEIDAGALDPLKAPDAFNLSMLRLIDRAMGKGKRASNFGYLTKEWEVLDRSVTRLTLKAFVSGEMAAPTRPPELTKAFKWDDWLLTADALRKGRPILPEQRLAAAYLLADAGRHGEAVKLLTQLENIKGARTAAYELMLHLGDLCGDHLGAISSGQFGIYTFEDTPRPQ